MGNGTKTTSYGMLKGYFPRDPTLVSAQASLGISPEWDPGWESTSIEHLGWGSGKWEVWSCGQNGGKPQGLDYPAVAPSPPNRHCCCRIPGHGGAPVGWSLLPAGHNSPSSLGIFLERETGVDLPDHLVVVAMRGSLSTAHTGAAPGWCWTGFPGTGLLLPGLPASRCSGSHPDGLGFGATSGGFGPYRESMWKHTSSAFSSLIWWLWSWDVLPRNCLGCRLRSGMEIHPLSGSALWSDIPFTPQQLRVDDSAEAAGILCHPAVPGQRVQPLPRGADPLPWRGRGPGAGGRCPASHWRPCPEALAGGGVSQPPLAVLLRAVRLVEIRLRPDLRAGPGDGGG
ncbi:PREDICTED: uncharacterized protein LOC108447969 [Corvus brachyrhynchos]|uniref:uncharacterized protein LOC108447969 n=1 Tax=Corvus brachyrhynchos TaxID=85066 RepID=UPI0008167394|nr:PREDICTED: uncharacterized protein LOC108447969 [Corvus brachyrhynchos]